MTISSASKKPSAAFAQYRAAVERELGAGIATEHTHRPALKTLIEQLDKVNATNEPKRSECGAPDYTVWRADGHGPMTLGYIEAKDVGTTLDAVEGGEQMGRYLPALNNLVLTDYLEFRWYLGGEWRRTERLATIDAQGHVVRAPGGQEAVEALLRDFLAQELVEIRQPQELAERMARLTHLIRDLIVESFERDAATKAIRDLRDAFSDVLIPHLSVPEFADMFAQTIAYGLFAARANHKATTPFRRHDAAYEIPKTNPFLRRLFGAITGPELDEEPYAGLVDDLTQLLAATDMTAVLATFGARTRQEDPVVHFYETFLAAYDPALRELRGVYYTPEPVVSYIVRSVDYLLRKRFDCSDGLAEQGTATYTRTDAEGNAETVTAPRVLILDPACGTGTFLYSVVDRIREQFIERHDAGKWSGFVREQLLPRLFGFELLMAPYAVAHLKLGLQLAAQDMPEKERADWAYDFAGGERLNVYLTNTLEEALKKSEVLLGSYISEEANAAAEIKRDLRILVVLGNPPYSGHSANASWREEKHPKDLQKKVRHRTWIGELMQDYYVVDGQPLGERNPKWLQDDYVKFLRFGQWRIDKSGAGILAFITNHAYLDNPTFRGMRQQLMKTFNDIHILDLHGNQKRKEKADDGRAEANVFDIQQGVAIALFVKYPDGPSPARIHHANLSNSDRKAKYAWLFEHDLSSTEWSEIEPSSPDYFFTKQDLDRKTEYELCFPIDKVMPEHNVGLVSGHDSFVFDFDEATLRARIADFLNTANSDEKVRTRYFGTEVRGDYLPGDSRDWKMAGVRKAIQDDPDWKDMFVDCLYRPFDVRPLFYQDDAVTYRRHELMRNLVSDQSSHGKLRPRTNIALVSARSNRSPTPDHFFCSRLVTEAKTGEATTQSYAFPLYLYPKDDDRSLFSKHDQSPWPAGEGGRRPNFGPEFIKTCAERSGLKFVSDGRGDLASTFGPEDLFAYAYAVFHSQTYRDRYAAFLKTNFPRLPITSNPELFRTLVARGEELIALHTLESPLLSASMTHYPVKGSDEVAEMPRYIAPGEHDPLTDEELTEGRVYISKDNKRTKKRGQYIEGVPPEVWAFTVGGYQVCHKWLKDRRGRALTLDEIERYEKIVKAISETIRVMDEIDEAIPAWPLV